VSQNKLILTSFNFKIHFERNDHWFVHSSDTCIIGLSQCIKMLNHVEIQGLMIFNSFSTIFPPNCEAKLEF